MTPTSWPLPSEATPRRKWPRIAASTAALLLGTGIFLAVRPEPGPLISGKPIAHWVHRIGDLDPNVRNDAMGMLMWAEPHHLEPHRQAMEKTATVHKDVAEFLSIHLAPIPQDDDSAGSTR